MVVHHTKCAFSFFMLLLFEKIFLRPKSAPYKSVGCQQWSMMDLYTFSKRVNKTCIYNIFNCQIYISCENNINNWIACATILISRHFQTTLIQVINKIDLEWAKHSWSPCNKYIKKSKVTWKSKMMNIKFRKEIYLIWIMHTLYFLYISW